MLLVETNQVELDNLIPNKDNACITTSQHGILLHSIWFQKHLLWCLPVGQSLCCTSNWLKAFSFS